MNIGHGLARLEIPDPGSGSDIDVSGPSHTYLFPLLNGEGRRRGPVISG